MPCTTTLNSQLTGQTANGIFQYVGFSISSTGTPVLSNYPSPFSAGGLNQGYNTSINWNNMPVGFYTFNYIVGTSPCTNTSTIKVQVLQQPTVPAGPIPTQTFCNTTNTPVPLMPLIPGASTGVWSLTYQPVGGSASNVNLSPLPPYLSNTQPNLTFNPFGIAAGTYTFTYTATSPTAFSGYNLQACTDCNPVSISVIFNISAPNPAPTVNPVSGCI